MINIGSVMGQSVNQYDNAFSYSASKAAVARTPHHSLTAGTVAPSPARLYRSSRDCVSHPYPSLTPSTMADGADLTRVLGASLTPKHITVNCIAPAFFPSKMTAFRISDDGEADPMLVAQHPIGQPSPLPGVLPLPLPLTRACLMCAVGWVGTRAHREGVRYGGPRVVSRQQGGCVRKRRRHPFRRRLPPRARRVQTVSDSLKASRWVWSCAKRYLPITAPPI